MARLVTSGFEVYVANSTGGPDGSNLGNAFLTRATTGQRSGSGCLRINPAAVNGAHSFTLVGTANERGYWARVYLKIATLPTAGVQVLALGSNVLIDTAGRIYSTLAGGTSAALNDGAWHRLEYHIFCSATQASRNWELRVDGATVSSGTAQSVDATAPTTFDLGVPVAATFDFYFDDVAVNDDQGSSQNSWPGDGAVVCVQATADSAVGTGWTGGAGATTGLFDAVNNTPPTVAADPGTNTSQIRNATSNANVNYDATMQTYTAAGVPSGATVNVVDPVVLTAAPVATSAKLGTVGVVSNPAITSVNLGATGTSGAFWQGSAAAAWPSGWKWSHGTVTHAPSVTLGTAPVMRVQQVTASTRIAIVGGMFIYVDYTPAGAPPAAKKPRVLSTNVPAMRAALR